MARKGKRDERTLRMMENYVKHHEEGMSVEEIANFYGITSMTIYNRLGEIAQVNNVPRESLLCCPEHSHDNGGLNGGYGAFRPYDLIRGLFDEADRAIEELSSRVCNSISANVQEETL